MIAPARVLAVSARCPLGLTAQQVALGWRADAIEPREHPLRDRNRRRIGVCRVGGLEDALYGCDRILALAAPALAELAGACVTAWDGPPPAVVLSLPEAGRADDDPRFAALVAEIAARSGVPIDVAGSAVVRGGHAGFAEAIERAVVKLDAGAQVVVAGGVDSWLHPGVIAELDRGYRLHSLTSDDGFIPSEGAAFVLLSRAVPRRTAPIARVRYVATAIEETVRTGEPNFAAAMRRLVRDAGHAVAETAFPWVLTDLNGERYRNREWLPVEAQEPLHPDVIHDRGPMRLGDLGAATGAVLLAIASTSFRMGWAPARSALIALASDGPARGVVCVEAPSP